MSIPKITTVAVALLFSFGSAAAQDPGEKPDVRGRKAWLVATAIPDDVENPIKVLSGKKLVEVTLSKRSVSNPVKVSGEGPLRVVREIENPDDPNKPAYETLAEAKIPENMGRALVILVPIEKTENGMVFATKVQDLSKFGGGHTLYMNLSPRNVMVQLGADKIGLKSGEVEIHDAGNLGEARNLPISYHHYDSEKKKWKLLSASTIVLRPTQREICIFSWDPRFDRIAYHGVTFPVAR